MNQTTIRNAFTGYESTINHAGEMPAISTVKKHLRAAKAGDCLSATKITQRDGDRTIQLDIIDTGNGERLVHIG